MNTNRIRVILAALALVTMAAPAAHADSNDDLYIAALNKVGAGTSRAPREVLIHLGHTICSDLSSGRTPDAEMKGMFAESNVTEQQAAMLVVASIEFYCPQYKYEIQGQ